MNNTPITQSGLLRSITNEMIVLQYNLSVEHFNLKIVHYLLHKQLGIYFHCSVYQWLSLLSRKAFAERGRFFFYKVPAVLRDYLSAIPVKINEKATIQTRHR